MSFNGSGTFVINSTGNPVVTGTTISSTWANALTADLATGLSTCVLKDGTQTTTARVPFASGISTFGTTNNWTVISITRSMTAASGDVAYTGAGFTPGSVIFFFSGPSTVVGGGSWGFDTLTAHKAIIANYAAAGTFAADASNSVSIIESGTQSQTAVVKSMDSDGFTLTWTKTGTPTSGTATGYALCLKAL